MKNISKLAILILLFNCIMCLSAKAQLGGLDEYFAQQEKKRREQQIKEIQEQFAKNKEKWQKEQKKREYIQTGLIIGGVFAVPMLIVSTTLIISTIKEKRHEKIERFNCCSWHGCFNCLQQRLH